MYLNLKKKKKVLTLGRGGLREEREVVVIKESSVHLSNIKYNWHNDDCEI